MRNCKWTLIPLQYDISMKRDASHSKVFYRKLSTTNNYYLRRMNSVVEYGTVFLICFTTLGTVRSSSTVLTNPATTRVTTRPTTQASRTNTTLRVTVPGTTTRSLASMNLCSQWLFIVYCVIFIYYTK